MAMGRTEMECPVELWVIEDNSPGHPNEEVLSMLQSVRSYLHRHIFRPKQQYPTLSDFYSHFLSTTKPSDEKLFQNLNTCNELYLPLVELLGSTGDDAAPERLLRMLRDSSKSFWLCQRRPILESTSKKEIYYDITIEYLMRLKRGIVPKTLTNNEIDDFQSSVVLAQTEKRTEETISKIQNFVESFAWLKALRIFLEEMEVIFFVILVNEKKKFFFFSSYFCIFIFILCYSILTLF
jgi:hypothetical protein